MSDITPTPTHGISRRKVVIGAAWSVPAIVLATAVPAVAASGPAKFTITGSVTYTDRTLLFDQIRSGPLTVTNTGGTPAAPQVRFTFVGLAALNLLPPVPSVAGWTGSTVLLDLGGGLGLLSTWVYTYNTAVASGAAVPFAGFGDVTMLVGTANGVRVTVSPPDTAGPNIIVSP